MTVQCLEVTLLNSKASVICAIDNAFGKSILFAKNRIGSCRFTISAHNRASTVFALKGLPTFVREHRDQFVLDDFHALDFRAVDHKDDRLHANAEELMRKEAWRVRARASLCTCAPRDCGSALAQTCRTS